MITDMRGIKIDKGAIILFNNVEMEVLETSNNVIIGGAMQRGNVIPGKIVCQCVIDIDTTRPVNCIVLPSKKEQSRESVS